MTSFTASDGALFAYYIDDFTDPWRKAPTLLLLHAAMGSSRRYYAWVPLLSRHYRVVRMDLRGHGGSEVPPADRALTLERLVADVIELMDKLGVASAHIVGNSAGGYLSQQLAMNHGERARSLMLFGSTPGLKNSQAPSWIPQIEEKGLRGFPRRDDRRAAAPRRGRSGARRVVSRRGRQERPGLYLRRLSRPLLL